MQLVIDRAADELPKHNQQAYICHKGGICIFAASISAGVCADHQTIMQHHCYVITAMI